MLDDVSNVTVSDCRPTLLVSMFFGESLLHLFVVVPLTDSYEPKFFIFYQLTCASLQVICRQFFKLGSFIVIVLIVGLSFLAVFFIFLLVVSPQFD